MKLYISTPYGDSYTIHENGNIERNDRRNTPSETWRMKGIEHVKRNEFIPFDKITPELLEKLDILYKNGNPQYTVRDLDHGTTRVWGNTKYHGIKYIYFTKEV